MRSSVCLALALVSMVLAACNSSAKTGSGGTGGGGSGGAVPGTGGGAGGEVGVDAATVTGGASGSAGQVASADAGGRDVAVRDGANADAGRDDTSLDGGGVILGPRCTTCTPRCWDSSLVRTAPSETCTARSPLAGIASHFDLVLTMPDSSQRYLVDSPFDMGSPFAWNWSFDSAKGRTFSQGVHCGKVEMTGVPTGDDTASPTSVAKLTVTVDGTAYSSTKGAASVALHMKEPLGKTINDPDTGPLFDLEVSGTLVATSGASIGIQGRMRNMHAGLGEKGLGRREGSIAGPGSQPPALAISSGTLVVAPVLVSNSATVLLLDGTLAGDKSFPLPEAMGLVAFPNGTLLAGGLDSVRVVAYDGSGTQMWATPPISRTGLTRAGMLARNDGSACFSAGGPRSASATKPSLLVCTDATGVQQWQTPIFPVISPEGPTELADGTLVVADGRSPEVLGVAPDGKRRFELVACTTDPTNKDPPYYKSVGVARDVGGGGVVQVGDDVIAFSAAGDLRWRSLVPRGNGEPLVAADALTVPAIRSFRTTPAELAHAHAHAHASRQPAFQAFEFPDSPRLPRFRDRARRFNLVEPDRIAGLR